MKSAVTLRLPASILISRWICGSAQEKLKAACLSLGASNTIWEIAKERVFYKKQGLDVALSDWPKRSKPLRLLQGKSTSSPASPAPFATTYA
jgi:hypothetical protein